MWLTTLITKQKNGKSASTGSITASESGKVEVDTSRLHRNVPVVAPYGVYYVPAIGSEGVLLPTESGQALVGVLSTLGEDLKPGELMLRSAGGATLVLKNNGAVVINGTEFGGV